MPPRGRIRNYKQPLPPLAAAPRSEPTVSNLLRSFETVVRSAERYCSGCGPHSRILHFAVLRAAPARSSAMRPAFRRWTASGKLPVATAAACRLFFLVFLYWGKEQSFARVFGGRKGDVRRQRAYRRKQKFASLIFDSGKRFCPEGTVAVAVGIRRPYISLRSGAAPARPCAKRPAFRRWTASGKLPGATPLRGYSFLFFFIF